MCGGGAGVNGSLAMYRTVLSILRDTKKNNSCQVLHLEPHLMATVDKAQSMQETAGKNKLPATHMDPHVILSHR